MDALLEAGIRTVGPTKAGSEIEWNKSFSRSLLSEVAPEANPRFAIVTTGDDIDALIAEIGNGGPVAIKPIGLTAGKGVKVVGPHLADNAAAADYVRELLASSPEAAAHIEERITAPEFTIQAITDGSTIVFPPATYDYPYRYDGDRGPGLVADGLLGVEDRVEVLRHLVEQLGEGLLELVFDRDVVGGGDLVDLAHAPFHKALGLGIEPADALLLHVGAVVPLDLDHVLRARERRRVRA